MRWSEKLAAQDGAMKAGLEHFIPSHSKAQDGSSIIVQFLILQRLTLPTIRFQTSSLQKNGFLILLKTLDLLQSFLAKLHMNIS